MEEAFYTTVAQVGFALLGLWWVVVGFKFEDWRATPRLLRAGYDVSLYFLFPATMSLLALLTTEEPLVWRVSFGVASALGALESVGFLRTRLTSGDDPAMARTILFLTPAVYALVLFGALTPTTLRRFPGDLTPLQIEGILLTLLLFFGVNLAWAMWFAGTREPAPSP